MMNESMMNANPTEMLESPNLEFSAMESLETGAMELSDDELNAVAGGCGINLGDLDGFNQSSGNFYSKKNLAVNQATFAGPEGSGTISSVGFEQIDSGAFQNISLG